MKVFVYRKDDCSKVAVLKGVTKIEYIEKK